ncbi:MAG: hypothetical protein SH809_15380 [Rhodothermales bacterium]|nr:hypothetical protein [Rhodothermales bacterium]
MMKEAVRALETGALAEVGLIAFVLAFTLILVWTFTLSGRFRDAAKHMPLNEAEPFPTEKNHV